jgi:hypothetical protein
MSFSPPKEWQEWVSLLLGVWLCVSPWALHFTDDIAATSNVISVGFFMIMAEAFTISGFAVLEELIDVAIGTWLVVSVWLLGISTLAAKIDLIVGGLVVLLFAFYEIWSNRRAASTRS